MMADASMDISPYNLTDDHYTVINVILGLGPDDPMRKLIMDKKTVPTLIQQLRNVMQQHPEMQYAYLTLRHIRTTVILHNQYRPAELACVNVTPPQLSTHASPVKPGKPGNPGAIEANDRDVLREAILRVNIDASMDALVKDYGAEVVDVEQIDPAFVQAFNTINADVHFKLTPVGGHKGIRIGRSRLV